MPLRCTIKDMGRSLSHRSAIAKEWLKGREYTEISRTTHHSIAAVKSYIEKFKRVVALAGEGFDAYTIAFLVKISAPLVRRVLPIVWRSGLRASSEGGVNASS